MSDPKRTVRSAGAAGVAVPRTIGEGGSYEIHYSDDPAGSFVVYRFLANQKVASLKFTPERPAWPPGDYQRAFVAVNLFGAEADLLTVQLRLKRLHLRFENADATHPTSFLMSYGWGVVDPITEIATAQELWLTEDVPVGTGADFVRIADFGSRDIPPRPTNPTTPYPVFCIWSARSDPYGSVKAVAIDLEYNVNGYCEIAVGGVGMTTGWQSVTAVDTWVPITATGSALLTTGTFSSQFRTYVISAFVNYLAPP